MRACCPASEEGAPTPPGCAALVPVHGRRFSPLLTRLLPLSSCSGERAASRAIVEVSREERKLFPMAESASSPNRIAIRGPRPSPPQFLADAMSLLVMPSMASTSCSRTVQAHAPVRQLQVRRAGNRQRLHAYTNEAESLYNGIPLQEGLINKRLAQKQVRSEPGFRLVEKAAGTNPSSRARYGAPGSTWGPIASCESRLGAS